MAKGLYVIFQINLTGSRVMNMYAKGKEINEKFNKSVYPSVLKHTQGKLKQVEGCLWARIRIYSLQDLMDEEYTAKLKEAALIKVQNLAVENMLKVVDISKMVSTDREKIKNILLEYM